ncbi:MAG: tRNA(Ile)-lysidine synthase [Acidobacteriota bacterium]|nr:tRNA(Ile)-lysidine synthase [Acidobacteriota bacterium]
MGCRLSVLETLDAFLTAELAAGSRGPWVVAFSGGGDSTALALALAELAPRHEVDLHLLHVDHGLDSGSAGRAEAAAALARRVGLPCTCERHHVPEAARRKEGTEAAARRVRYAALEAFRRRTGADRILTAHHRDDQIETLLLRLAAGSGLAGLSGIQRRRGAILRPLLDLDRTVLDAFIRAKGIDPLADPTNRDLTIERNRVRHRLWPLLARQEPGLGAALVAVAAAAERARIVLDRRLEKLLVKEGWGLPRRLEIAALLPLPEPLPLFALGFLERRAGRERPGSTRSKRELLRQLAASPKGNLESPASAAAGLYWHASGGFLWLAGPTPAGGVFSYILEAPGEVEVPEIRGRIRLSRQPFAAWMRTGERRRAALAFPPGDLTGGGAGGDRVRVEVRNRRPGDRIRSLGAPGMRRLKELLIDHKVPRAERDRLPLLLVEGTIAWVPGITIADRYRLQDESLPWVVEWLDNPQEDFQRRTIEDVPAAGREESGN